MNTPFHANQRQSKLGDEAEGTPEGGQLDKQLQIN